MDKTISIKENLISRIQNSNDLTFLKKIQTLFDNTENELFELSDEQKTSIDQGRIDISDQKYLPHDKVMNDTKEWLKNL